MIGKTIKYRTLHQKMMSHYKNEKGHITSSEKDAIDRFCQFARMIGMQKQDVMVSRVSVIEAWADNMAYEHRSSSAIDTEVEVVCVALQVRKEDVRLLGEYYNEAK